MRRGSVSIGARHPHARVVPALSKAIDRPLIPRKVINDGPQLDRLPRAGGRVGRRSERTQELGLEELKRGNPLIDWLYRCQ